MFVVQILGRWKVNNPALAILWKEALMLIQNFEEFSIRQIGRVGSLSLGT